MPRDEIAIENSIRTVCMGRYASKLQYGYSSLQVSRSHNFYGKCQQMRPNNGNFA